MAPAGDRLRPPARRRHGRGAAPLGRATAAGLGADGRRWRRLFGRTVGGFDALADDIMGPLLRMPHAPGALARFGAPTRAARVALAQVFRTEQARALFGGVAAHAFRPLDQPLTSAIGLGHPHRRAPPRLAGRGRRLAVDRRRDGRAAGRPGRQDRDRRPHRFGQPAAARRHDDVGPRAGRGRRHPRRPAAAPNCPRLPRFRYGPGAFKVDFAVEGGVPWTNPAARRAGTVHLGGAYAEIAATERDIHAGRMPERPFVLVGQQYLADPRAPPATCTPCGPTPTCPTATPATPPRRSSPRSSGSPRASATASSARPSAPPPNWPHYNPNYVGGNIMTGAKDIRQLVFGPRTTLSPYDTGMPGNYICSAATPPGPGAHGMCGANAGQTALRDLGVQGQAS